MMQPRFLNFWWLVCALLSPAAMVHAQSTNDESNYLSRLVPFESSHIIFQRAQHDEVALNAKYSFRYAIASSEPRHMPCRGASPDAVADGDCREWFFAYNGEFDFYAGTRPSGPVINRVSNPSGHFRWRDREGSYFDFGVEHRSNGQILEPNDQSVRNDAARAYAIGDHAYFDAMSRGSNFASLELHKRMKGMRYTSTAKFYFTQDGEVTWGPDASAKPKLSHYDLIRLQARTEIGRLDFGIEWMIGSKGMRTDSWKADASFVLWGLPWYVRYHNGPMRTLANYTVAQRAIGFGIKLLPDPWAREDNNARRNSKNL
jgi:hypothetical protein